MAWPWRKRRTEAGPRLIVRCGQVDIEEVDLGQLAESDLEEWLESPFWKAVKANLGHRIEETLADLVSGDVAARNRDEQGLCYRSDEALRAGLIETEYLRTIVETELRNQLARDQEIARQEREKEYE